jgi:hypothetical protein
MMATTRLMNVARASLASFGPSNDIDSDITRFCELCAARTRDARTHIFDHEIRTDNTKLNVLTYYRAAIYKRHRRAQRRETARSVRTTFCPICADNDDGVSVFAASSSRSRVNLTTLAIADAATVETAGGADTSRMPRNSSNALEGAPPSAGAAKSGLYVGRSTRASALDEESTSTRPPRGRRPNNSAPSGRSMSKLDVLSCIDCSALCDASALPLVVAGTERRGVGVQKGTVELANANGVGAGCTRDFFSGANLGGDAGSGATTGSSHASEPNSCSIEMSSAGGSAPTARSRRHARTNTTHATQNRTLCVVLISGKVRERAGTADARRARRVGQQEHLLHVVGVLALVHVEQRVVVGGGGAAAVVAGAQLERRATATAAAATEQQIAARHRVLRRTISRLVDSAHATRKRAEQRRRRAEQQRRDRCPDRCRSCCCSVRLAAKSCRDGARLGGAHQRERRRRGAAVERRALLRTAEDELHAETVRELAYRPLLLGASHFGEERDERLAPHHALEVQLSQRSQHHIKWHQTLWQRTSITFCTPIRNELIPFHSLRCC